jgi:abortive infection bacteriophage resistance protein
MPQYTKPHLSFHDQLQLLRQRGLLISDDQAAEAALSSIGYYRLAAYLYTFRQLLPHPDLYGSGRADSFQPGYSIDHSLALWDFDRRLRSVTLQAMELLEVAVRTSIAFEAGRAGPFAYLDPAYVEPRSTVPRPQSNGQVLTDLDRWTSRLVRMQDDSREEFVEHYRRKYASSSPGMPVWVSVEVWDFGLMSRYYTSIMPYAGRLAVSRVFGVQDVNMFSSWIRSLNVVRNIAAHHSRLWNRKLAIQPRLPKRGILLDFDHVAGDRNAIGTTIYPVLLIMAYLTRQLGVDSRWASSACDVLDTFPSVPGHTMQMLGFPVGWEREAVWN